MEIKYLKKLEGLVENNLINGGQPNPNQLACLASYKALYEYSWVHLLSIPVELDSIRRKQILEPEEEKQIRLKIPVLQDITNPVSSKVRDQYERNPFPRWVTLKLELSPKPIPDANRSTTPITITFSGSDEPLLFLISTEKDSISFKSPGLKYDVLKLLSGGPKGSPEGIIEALATTSSGFSANNLHISSSVVPYLGSKWTILHCVERKKSSSSETSLDLL